MQNKQDSLFSLLIICFLFLIACQGPSKKNTKDLKGLGIANETQLISGLALGEKAPRITFERDGNLFDSEKTVKAKKLILVFYRGEWCPICNRHLTRLKDSLDLLTEAGAELWLISPEKAEYSKITNEKLENKLLIINDSTQQIMRDYKIAFDVTQAYQDKVKTKLDTDLAIINGAAVLPIPATYILDENHRIAFAHVDPNYRKRLSVSSILKNL